MFATEENIKRLKRAQEIQERLDKLQNCPCLSLTEEEKMKKELDSILKKLTKDAFMQIQGIGTELEEKCKHVLAPYEYDYPPHFFEESCVKLYD